MREPYNRGEDSNQRPADALSTQTALDSGEDPQVGAALVAHVRHERRRSLDAAAWGCVIGHVDPEHDRTDVIQDGKQVRALEVQDLRRDRRPTLSAEAMTRRQARDIIGWSDLERNDSRVEQAYLVYAHCSMFRRLRVPVLLGLVFGALLAQAAPASAVWRGRAPVHPGKGTNTDLVMSGTGPGQSVRGFIAKPGTAFNPVLTRYPASPPAGFEAKDESFAGIIHAHPPGGGANLSLYCIDILTATYGGIGYTLGTWDASNVPNVEFVARLLDEYYPNTPAPALASDNQTAAAVQAAIWYFTDKYVLAADDPLHSTVAAIVAHIQIAGPVGEQPKPSLTISPSHLSAPAGKLVGPFTVTSNHPAGNPSATVTATGGDMFSDAAATQPIAQNASVPSGQEIWLRSTGSTVAVLEATAQATVPHGNVYLYDGNTTGVSDAQHLILAKTDTLKTTVSGTAEFLAPGSLVVKKTIAGDAAGSQARVVIEVDCDDGVTRPDFIIPPRAPAGTTSMEYKPIDVGTKCTVIETSNGTTVGTEVVVTGDGQQVTIPSGKSETVEVTDTYHHVGSLLVRKTIAGPGAGQQGEIRIHTVCNGTALTPDFVIPPNTPTGDKTQQYDHIRTPATCKVTETVDGHTSTVAVAVEGSGQTVSVPVGDIVEADISDTYGLLPGELEVTKTIAGPLAGQQGTVVIHTVCNGTALPDFVISPVTPAGDQSRLYSDIPTPASCVVTETTDDGHTSTVSVAVTGSPHTSTIPPGGSGAAHITDIYGPTPGSLLVTKTIAGRFAGHQGPVTIHVACNGVALSPDFVIAAGARAGSVSHSFDGIPAGSMCTVTETTDGATATVAATVAGNGQKVTIPAGKVVPVNVMDVFQGTPGSLKVTKTIAGRAARQHGRISLLVACGSPLRAYAFHIRAHVAGPVSRYFNGLGAGSRCAVIEAGNGHTARVSVVAKGNRKRVSIHANRRATAHLTDTFRPRARPKPPPPSFTG